MAIIKQYFETDHQRLDQLFAAFVANLKSDTEQAERFFTAFSQGLKQHIKWEEEALFPHFESLTGMTTGPTMVMCSEHEQIINLLNAIATKLSNGDCSAMPEVDYLQEILLSHNQKEEQVLYPMLDRLCDEHRQSLILLAMAQMH